MPPSKDEFFRDFQIQEFFRRLEAVGERLSTLASTIAVQAERQRNLTEEISETNKKLDAIDKRLDVQEASALRMAGGLAVLAMLGMGLGWIISGWSGIINFFKGLIKNAT
jgi:hypothetical protein